MSKLYFYNPGEIDIRAATLLGVNVKAEEHREAAFGRFGSGLKYVIAGVLRLGGEIVIHSGERKYWFESRSQLIRDQAFDVVVMQEPCGDGSWREQPLGFTTAFGREWQPWQLLRELVANALDEGGRGGEEACMPFAGATVVEVDCAELWEAWQHKEEFWLDRRDEPLWQCAAFEVFDGPSAHLFYQGIRVTPDDAWGKGQQLPLTFNLLGLQALSEDRQLSSLGGAMQLVAQRLLGCDNAGVLEACFDSGLSDQFDWDWPSVKPGPEFVALVLRRIKAHDSVPRSAREALTRHELTQQLDDAEHPRPGSWAEALELEPPAPEVESSYYTWMNEMEKRMRGLERRVVFWRGWAEQLSVGQEATEAAEADGAG